ncbi:TBC domain containing protein [Histomonas meleagridis]|uniref:TBC domain containing protein n=1 Tax=Histomonas meleagridis TaxID=135588 RepID=UPI0035595EB2|nr:TBC domain containing protein [Histomonas meleagridis]KAH0802770.1 TBC domain containing protein [Histomonas meleagridis]
MEFYHHCHNGVFPYKPTNIHLIVDRNEGSLERIWKKFHVFVQSLFSQLDISNTIPNDPSYPFLTAARASHQRVLDEIINYIKNSTQQPPLTNTEWQNFFDSDGRLTDFDHIKNRIYHSGVEASLLPDVIPFIFGLHKSDSTSSERNDINLQLDHEFDVLLRQTKSYQPQQVSNNKKMYAAFRVIHHDILRTDRQLSAFKKENGIGLKILTDLLRTYTIYNPPIGYLQGMNDLFVPILLAFIPKWDESSSPVTENGYEQYLPRIFWSFDSMLQHLHHMKMLNDIATECEKMTGVVFSILSEVSPLASIWLRKNNLQNLLWMYSDFVLLFKRSFDDVWSVWTKLSTSPDPPNWFSYFTAAILILIFNEIGTLEEITTPVIMDSFSKFMAKLNVDDIGLAAMYLYERFKVPKKKEEKNKNVKKEFKYFKPEWNK